MAFLANKSIYLIEIESVAGTAETPTATDFDLLVVDGVMKFAPEIEKLNFATGSHAKQPQIAGKQTGTFTCKVPLRPGAAVSTAPKWLKLMQACGGVGAVEGTDKGYSITPLSTGDVKTVTIWEVMVERGTSPVGIRRCLGGCMGNVVIGAEGVGKPVMAEFNFTGKYIEGAAISNGDLATLNVLTGNDTTAPYIFCGATFTIAGTAHQISAYKLDAGNEIQPEYDGTDTNCIDYYAITDRNPVFSCNPLVKAYGTYDATGVMKAATTGTIILTVTSGVIPLKITIPVAQIQKADPATREGLKSWDLEYAALQNGTAASPTVAGIAVEAAWELLQGAKS